MGDNKLRSSVNESVRVSLKKVMRPNQWFSAEELMDGTGYDSRLIRGAMKTWRKKGMVRVRHRGETRDNEYRLVR